MPNTQEKNQVQPALEAAKPQRNCRNCFAVQANVVSIGTLVAEGFAAESQRLANRRDAYRARLFGAVHTVRRRAAAEAELPIPRAWQGVGDGLGGRCLV